MNQNQFIKPPIRNQATVKVTTRLRSAGREQEQNIQQNQNRQAIQNPAYRNTTADKHKNHSQDKTKQIKLKAKKKKIKKQQVQQQEIESEEQRLLLELELKRRSDLERFLREQFEQMTIEEKQRLSQEENDRIEFESNWQKNLFEYKKHNILKKEWESYLNCDDLPDPRNEKALNTLLFMLISDQDDIQIFNKQINQTYQIITQIEIAKLEDLSENIQNKIDYYNKYLQIFREILNNKLKYIIKQYIKNYESFLEENNKILKTQYFMPEYTKENLQRILQRISQKQDEKSKYEIYKSSPYHETYQTGYWFNPLSKAGYRIKPVEFINLHSLQAEIPRQFVAESFLYKAIWTKWDPFSSFRHYEQYLPISGIFQIECLELPKLSKKTQSWALVPQYEGDTIIKPLKYNPQQFPSFHISFQISKSYYTTDASKMFVITFSNGRWTNDHVEDLKINLENRLVSFKIKDQLPFTLAIHKFIDFPFQHWKLVYISDEKISIKITTARNITLVIHLSNQAQLIEPKHLIKQFPQFEKTMHPMELLICLRNIGINLIGTQEDAVCMEKPFKLDELENQALLHIMQILKQFSFQSSNIHSGVDCIHVQFIENQFKSEKVSEDDEFKWKNLQIQLNKVALVDEKNEWVKNTVSHANILLLLQEHEITTLNLIQEVQDIGLLSELRTFLKVMHLLAIN